MAVQIVTLDGRKFTPSMRDAIVEAQRLLPFALRITQGGFNRGGVSASAGTHDGDAVDFSVSGLTQAQVAAAVTTLRKVGIAAWFRTTSAAKWGTRAQGFGSYHIHGVPNGWGAPSAGARAQATAYRNARDGLRGNGADLGPGHVSTYRARTWRGYLLTTSSRPKPAPTPTPDPPKEPDMAISDDDLAKIGNLVNAKLVDYIERQNRFVPQDGSGITTGRPLSHFVVQGQASAAIAARNTAALLARAGVSAQEVIAGVVEGITPDIREAVVDAMGEIDREYADAVADQVLDGLGKRLQGGQ